MRHRLECHSASWSHATDAAADTMGRTRR